MRITKEAGDEIFEEVLFAGNEGPFTYVSLRGDPHMLFLRCSKHGVVDSPEPDTKNTYWDSLEHGISWTTEKTALAAISAAYELMDHKRGQLEEWDAQPLRFDNRTLVEKLVQPGYRRVGTPNNNATHLTGSEGCWGLRINVGGSGWGQGVSLMGIEECAKLETVFEQYGPSGVPKRS